MTSIALRTAATVLAISTLVACAAANPAAAAGEPQITAAGIDAGDRVTATWTLAPGTTFDDIRVASSPILEKDMTEFFADVTSFAGSECAAPDRDCGSSPTQTSYRQSYPLSRDRRYFVIVSAKAGNRVLTSQMWVIDEAKPLIPGEGKRPDRPTNSPVLGRPYVPPAPGAIPQPRLSLLAPTPTTIAGFVRRGVRARLTCPIFVCYAFVSLDLDGTTSVLRDGSVRPGGRRTFVLRPTTALRARLRVRSRARLRLSIVVTHPAGKQTEIVRSISLRR